MIRRAKINHKWTDEERDYVRVHYRGNNRSAEEIAHALGVSFCAVKGQVTILGVQKNTDYRKEWTKQEEKQLRQLVHTHCPRRIAKIMNRGLGSITNKIKRLGLRRRYRTGWFTKQEVCEILGVDHKWVQRRISERQLKATYHDGKRPSSRGMRRWHIEDVDLANYLRRHARDLDGRNVDLPMIIWLMDIPKDMNGNRRRKKRKSNNNGSAPPCTRLSILNGIWKGQSNGTKLPSRNGAAAQTTPNNQRGKGCRVPEAHDGADAADR